MAIGEICDIAPHVTILTGTHEIGDISGRAGKGITTGVLIGNGIWIGVRTMILPGIKIGGGLDRGSLVTKDVPDNFITTGVSAKIKPIEENK